MGRPPREETASTRHIGFRLTDDEETRLDELVLEQGHRDRSALLRAWLAQGGPTSSPRTNYRQTQYTNANTTRSSKPIAAPRVEAIPARRRHPRIIATPRTMDSSPSRDESSRATPAKSVMRELLAELHRHKEPHLGLIRVANVVRALLPHASLDAVHDALLTLAKHGTIELRPDGGTEFLKAEEAAVCPRGPRDTVFAYARLIDPR